MQQLGHLAWRAASREVCLQAPASLVCQGALTTGCRSYRQVSAAFAAQALAFSGRHTDSNFALTSLHCMQHVQWQSSLRPARACVCAATTSGRGFAALPAQEAADAGMLLSPCSGSAHNAHIRVTLWFQEQPMS